MSATIDTYDRQSVIDYLMREGNHAVPCSRYGVDTEECAPVAYAAAKRYAERSGEYLTIENIDSMMGLVVNDHDDVEVFLGETCPECGERNSRYTGSTPSGEWQEWTCDTCDTFFKVLPDIGEEDE